MSRRPLELGFLIQPVHPPQRDTTTVLAEDREAVALADALGFSEAFVGEHLVDRAEPITSSLAFLASLADCCPRIGLGTGILPLPSYHPVAAAAQVAMVDHILGGRLRLGVGVGVPSDAEALGTLQLDRGKLTFETLEAMLALWRETGPLRIETSAHSGSTERTSDPELGIGRPIRPLQTPHPEIVLTAIRAESSAPERARERGWGGITASYAPPAVARVHVASYRRGLAHGGRRGHARGWRVARSIFVADDDTVARRYARSASGPHGYYFRNMMSKLKRARAGVFPPEMSLEEALESTVMAGDVARVVDQLLALLELTGPFETLLYTGHDWADASLARRSMRLMADEVMPRVNAVLTAQCDASSRSA